MKFPFKVRDFIASALLGTGLGHLIAHKSTPELVVLGCVACVAILINSYKNL